ncbi:hypothetical protein ACJIZ3_011959 [Penstemon smallii]|uniref:Uncharacterized protein n=1 Tax=Penstemon smallii TaxID=265156 RepID=A0ABD3ULW8_9LAMI
MGRGRAKGKKLSMTNQDDTGSGEEEKIPAQKRRGRPQKTLKDEVEEDEASKIVEEDSEEMSGVTDKADVKSKNGNKRRRNAQAKEKVDPEVKEENGNGTITSTEESNRSNGFRHTRSRRKNKPRRAAEAVVECT